ncbi:SPOR domain-containing protein [Thalassospira sp. MA62]|nr:SPOR domain-containing protein [Thalassospira sp. MA62]
MMLVTLGFSPSAHAQTSLQQAPHIAVDTSDNRSGIDMIPTDLPAHASTAADDDQPLSLLPGTIPVFTNATEEKPTPSLAEQYQNTLDGTPLRRGSPRKSPPKKDNVTVPAAPPVVVKGLVPPPVTTRPSPQQGMLAPVAATTPAAGTTPTQEVASSYVIQLGAFKSPIEAQTYWASFRIRYPDLSRDHERRLETADLGTRGAFHRLQLAGFQSLSNAQEKCRQLMADGTECFAKRQ